jgi:hypothetical protein
MGWRFRRSVKLLPGIRLNLSRSGVSTSIGVRGAHVTVGHGKVRETVGIPGTGISYTQTQGTHQEARSEARQQAVPEALPKGNAWRGRLWLVIFVAAAAVLSACGNKLSTSDCQKDAQCARAYNMAVSANRTVAIVCPPNPRETNAACESAMATLDTAEAEIFPRLKGDDARLLSQTL